MSEKESIQTMWGIIDSALNKEISEREFLKLFEKLPYSSSGAYCRAMYLQERLNYLEAHALSSEILSKLVEAQGELLLLKLFFSQVIQNYVKGDSAFEIDLRKKAEGLFDAINDKTIALIDKGETLSEKNLKNIRKQIKKFKKEYKSSLQK